MEPPDLPDEAATWAQYRRICAHPIFVRSPGHQELLRFLIQRCYGGEKDFSGKTIAFLHFKRDTTIAKVEGRTVRNKLVDYYKNDGRSDPIIINLPRKTFQPSIYQADREWNDDAVALLVDVSVEFEWPTQDGLADALETIATLNVVYPDDSGVLAIKALVHVMRTLYGENSRDEWELAELLVREADRHHSSRWELPFAKACIYASRCQWKQADLSFGEAFNLYRGYSSWEPRFNPWYTFFLASQKRFDEALKILEESSRHAEPHNFGPTAELGMMHILASNFEEAEKVFYWGLDNVRFKCDDDRFRPYLAVLYAAVGDFSLALSYLNDVTDTGKEPIIVTEGAAESIIGKSIPGLLPLFIGLSGDIKRAENMYSRLQSDRSVHRRNRPAFHLALAALGAGEQDEAVKWLAISIARERNPLALWMHVLPFLSPLHSHRRFRAVVTKLLHKKIKG